MSFKDYLKESLKCLKENYDSIEELLQQTDGDVKEILLDYDMNMDEEEVMHYVKHMKIIFQRALDYRNINNGMDYFIQKTNFVFPLEEENEIKQRLKRLFRWYQVKATKIEPDYYV